MTCGKNIISEQCAYINITASPIRDLIICYLVSDRPYNGLRCLKIEGRMVFKCYTYEGKQS